MAVGVTVGEWLRLVDSAHPDAWSTLLRCATELAGCERAADADDVAACFVAQQFQRGARDARRARDSTELGAWVRGCVRNLIRQERRRVFRESVLRAAGRPRRVHAVKEDDDRAVERSGEKSIGDAGTGSTAGNLTRRQADVLDCVRAQMSEREAARVLGLSRAGYRDLRRRAIAAMVRSRDPRAWSRAAIGLADRAADPVAGAVLRAYAKGRSYREIAGELGISPGAVGSRLFRMRSKLSART